MSKSIGNELYSDTISVGRIWAIISAITGTLFGIFFIIVGIYVIQHKSHLKSIKGDVVKDSDCNTAIDNGNQYTRCSTTVSYNINGKEYPNKIVNTESTKFTQGKNNITLWYSPTDPEKPEYSPTPTWAGWIIILIALLVIFGAWFCVWLTRKYKMAAAAVGASGIYSIITGH
tara:strand:+ start:3583 stop:4101 length:519 start_codon:yes stop_codon:yes gene_type:complete